MANQTSLNSHREPWNKSKLVGQKTNKAKRNMGNTHTIGAVSLDFTRFDRHIIMSKSERRKCNEGYQIYSRV